MCSLSFLKDQLTLFIVGVLSNINNQVLTRKPSGSTVIVMLKTLSTRAGRGHPPTMSAQPSSPKGSSAGGFVGVYTTRLGFNNVTSWSERTNNQV